jgi:antitoxin component YwqK of YwqJK toxin-antitoxin module
MYICIPENYLIEETYIFGSWNNWSEPINLENYDFKISSYLFYFVGEVEEVEYKLKIKENFCLLNDNFYLTRINNGFTNNVAMTKVKNNFWNGKIDIILDSDRIRVYLLDNIIFEGDFENGKVSGNGIYYYRNGKIQYEGNIQNGIIQGQGTTFDQDGKVLHKGNYLHNMLHGFCNLFDQNEKNL